MRALALVEPFCAVIATRQSPLLALVFETPRQDREGMVGEAI
jgi:hypothetical protein